MLESPTRARGPATPAQHLAFVPKEHGASLMAVHGLLLGVIAGLEAGGRDLAGLALAVLFGTLFVPLAAAVSVISHPKVRSRALRRAVTLGVALAAIGLLALVRGPAGPLLGLAGAGAGIAALYGVARARTGARSVPTQLAAIAGISLLAPCAWVLLGGGSDRWPLAAVAAFASFGGTVPYVRERVRRRRRADRTVGDRARNGLVALLWQALALALALGALAAGAVHPLVPIAFVPGAVKTFAGILRPESKPPVKRIGYLETVISTVFAALAGVGLGLAPLR